MFPRRSCHARLRARGSWVPCRSARGLGGLSPPGLHPLRDGTCVCTHSLRIKENIRNNKNADLQPSQHLLTMGTIFGQGPSYDPMVRWSRRSKIPSNRLQIWKSTSPRKVRTAADPPVANTSRPGIEFSFMASQANGGGERPKLAFAFVHLHV